MPGILKKCSCCAAKLEHRRKLCGRCKTPYCGPACQKKHWEEGGHDKLCKKIKKGGGAELYNADTKYKEAVAAAAKKCAEDTKGQTCYICMEAVHRRTGEGLVRGCGCGDRDGVDSGTTGVAHASCLVEQAKILVTEAEENKLDDAAFEERWARWHTCSMCKQRYHGVVSCALGWGCWKTYVGRPETDQLRYYALNLLGSGLLSAQNPKEAVPVMEAQLSMLRRLGESEYNILVAQSSLASAYDNLGRVEDVLRMRRDVYSGCLRVHGERHENTLGEASNLANSLFALERFGETKSFLRKTVPVARRTLGDDSTVTFAMRKMYAQALYMDADSTLDDFREAASTLEEVDRTCRRVLGNSHPYIAGIGISLQKSRSLLAVRKASARLEALRTVPFAVGATVELHGLVASPALNGRHVVVVQTPPDVAARGRISVTIDGAVRAVKCENVRAVPGGVGAAPSTR